MTAQAAFQSVVWPGHPTGLRRLRPFASVGDSFLARPILRPTLNSLGKFQKPWPIPGSPEPQLQGLRSSPAIAALTWSCLGTLRPGRHFRLNRPPLGSPIRTIEHSVVCISL